MKKIKLYGGYRNREVIGIFSSVSAAKKWVLKNIRVEKGFEVFVHEFSDLQVECNNAPEGGYYYALGRKVLKS